MDGGEEVARGFVVACGDGAELFELAKEVLDQTAFGVERLFISAWRRPIVLRRDDRHLSCLLERLEHPLFGIERLVGDEHVGLHLGQERIGPFQIVRFPARQQEAGRVAKRIRDGVDLGAQSAARAPDRLIRTPFLRAPALC